MKNRYSKIIIPTVYVSIMFVMVLSIIMIVRGVTDYFSEKTDYDFTINNTFDRDTLPVVSSSDDLIIRPYNNEDVLIGKHYYDYQSKAEEQESSIIYYENTYMQNSGVDYVLDEEFDIISVLDGEVISVEENEVYGKIITIKHNDSLKTVYSYVTNTLFNVGYNVKKGELIGTSIKSSLNDDKYALHFEVYYKEETIDPENLYTLSINEFR